jgi:hypothetical protein
LDGDKGVQMADSISEINRAFSLSFGSYNSKIIDDLFQVNKINDYTYGFYKKFRLAKATLLKAKSEGKKKSFAPRTLILLPVLKRL